MKVFGCTKYRIDQARKIDSSTKGLKIPYITKKKYDAD